jgi:hypothetical protein
MATESSYTIAPLSPETWSAFDALVASSGLLVHLEPGATGTHRAAW